MCRGKCDIKSVQLRVMRNYTICILMSLLMITTTLAGCLGDEEPAPDDETPDPTLGDWDVYYVASSADLPDCDADTLGRLYYVEADAGFKTCLAAGWTFIDLTGPAGADGASGMDGTNGTDGADGADGSDGMNGTDGAGGADGASGMDGTNGTDGSDGAGGLDGTNGTDGADGADGSDGMNGTDVLMVPMA
jgi:hypothetical protein